MTVSVYAIYHSQELRYYAWQMFFATLSLYFFVRGLESSHWRHWGSFALVTVLNLYTHPYALFLLGSQGLYTLGTLIHDELLPNTTGIALSSRTIRAIWHRSFPVGAAALLALVCFLPAGRHLTRFSGTGWFLDNPAAHNGTAGVEHGQWTAAPIGTWTYGLPAELFMVHNPIVLYAMLALFLLGLLSSAPRHAALVFACVLFPLPILWASNVFFYWRYFSYFLPILFIVMARGVYYLVAALEARPDSRLVLSAFLAALVVTSNVLQLPEYYREPGKRQWREAFAYIAADQRSGDVIIFDDEGIGYSSPRKPVEWYAEVFGVQLPWTLLYDGETRTSAKALGCLAMAVEGADRVWLLSTPSDSEGQATDLGVLEDRFVRVQEQRFLHLRLVLFEAIPLEGE